ncbi:MAG: hypothetical protein HY689_13370 [Chloroflexi bacterium]|nr:hypothetical protein [Chloroflexota bacterium]
MAGRFSLWFVPLAVVGLVWAVIVAAPPATHASRAVGSASESTVALHNPPHDPKYIYDVLFGLEGEPWDPPRGAGGVTRDRNTPAVAVVTTGTTVHFINRTGAPHRVAVYDTGLAKLGTGPVTTLADIDTRILQGSFIDDAEGRLVHGPSPDGVSEADRRAGAIDLYYTFTRPGQYLVICSLSSHFLNYGQATFVVVQDPPR